MKKSKMMRLACCLLVAVLMTTCAVSGTFAKYVAEGNATDTARVAKWGVTVVGTEATTFSKTYAAGENAPAEIGANSVISASKVVAPGTSGSLANFTVSGTPEVAGKITYTGEFSINDKWNVQPEGEDTSRFYCPLVIKVGDTTVDGSTYTDKATFEAAVNDAIAAIEAKYFKANEEIAADTADLTISWEWPFETTIADKGGNQDKADTALGDAAADNVANAGEVTLAVTATVEQID